MKATWSLLLIAITLGAANPSVPPVVDTQVIFSRTSVTSETLEILPISRDANNVLHISPGTIVQLPGKDRIVGTAPVMTSGALTGVLFETETWTSPVKFSWHFCELNAGKAEDCKVISGIPSSNPSLSYASSGISHILDVITKSGSMEFNQGIPFNPTTGLPQGGRFPMYTDPEKLFPPSIISSVGLSADGSASFQFVNFPSGSTYTHYYFFRHNNSSLRPQGPFVKSTPGEDYLSSGSLSSDISLDAAEEFRILIHRFQKELNSPNRTSQVKILKLNADTFQPIGSPIVVSPVLKSVFPINEKAQSTAIEPSGAFALWTNYSPACNKNLLMARALSSTGSLIGPIRVVRNCTQLGTAYAGVDSISIGNLGF